MLKSEKSLNMELGDIQVLNEKIYLVLKAIVAWLEENDTPYVVVGGIAASFLGRPRHTEDVDLIAAISLETLNSPGRPLRLWLRR